MAITNDGELDVRLKALRNHGMVHREGRQKYISELPGFNLRMSEILSLPMYPGLRREQVQYICQKIGNHLARNQGE